MTASVSIDPESGSATVFLSTPLPIGQALRFSLQNTRTQRYLTQTGWTANRKTVLETTPAEINAPLVIPAETAAHLQPGTPVLLESIMINLREPFLWPTPQVSQAPEVSLSNIPAAKEEKSSLMEPRGPDNLTEKSPAVPRRKGNLIWAIGIGVCLSIIAVYILFGEVFGSTPITPVSAGIESRSPLSPQQPKLVEAVNDSRLLELQKENTALKAQLDTLHQTQAASTIRPRETDAQTLNDLNNQLAVLKAENTGLANRVREQSKTITDWTSERIIDRQKLQDYEQQIALQDTKLKEVNVSVPPQQELTNLSSYWVAAAVNSRGSVEVVTQARARDEAQRQVLAKCTRTGTGCRFIGSYENACFSLARPEGHPILPGNYWYAGDAQKFNANKRAVMECNRVSGAYCSVAISFCASEAM